VYVLLVWVADFCEDNNIEFILGHALYMKAIHGGKAKNDKIDSYKITSLIRGGTFPQAFVYPRDMRATRDLLTGVSEITAPSIYNSPNLLKLLIFKV